MLVASNHARTWLYIAIDVCLTAGLLSLYVPRRHRMATAGRIGFFLALVGLFATRAMPAITPVDIYPVTAAAVAVGVVLLAFSEWRSGRMEVWIPLAFTLSLLLGTI